MAVASPPLAQRRLRLALPTLRLPMSHPTLVRLCTLGTCFVVWAVLAWGNQRWEIINPVLLPTPLEVWQSGYDMAQEGLLQEHLLVSLQRVGVGFGLAALLALTLGFLTGLSRLVRLVVEPLIEFLRPIPPLAFLPMFLVWFGLGEASKVTFIAYTTFFPMFVTIAAGVLHLDLPLLRAAASLGATRWQMLRYVVFPATLSSILISFRLGFSLAIFVIVGAEFLGADRGLGYLIMEGRTFFLPAQIFMGAIVLGILGFLVNSAFVRLERHLVRWRSTHV